MWIFASPLGFALRFGALRSSSGGALPVAMADLDATPASRQLVEAPATSPDVNLEVLPLDEGQEDDRE